MPQEVGQLLPRKQPSLFQKVRLHLRLYCVVSERPSQLERKYHLLLVPFLLLLGLFRTVIVLMAVSLLSL